MLKGELSRWPSLYIHKIEFSCGTLKISVGDAETPRLVVKFDSAAAFLKFDESDFFQMMKRYRTLNIATTRSADCGIFEIEENAILALDGNFLSVRGYKFYLLASPQECVEVASPIEPTFEHA